VVVKLGIFTSIFLTCLCLTAQGQSKSYISIDSLRAAAWVVGYVPAVIVSLSDSTIAIDSCKAIRVDTTKYPLCFSGAELSTSSICDINGNALLYTDFGGEPMNTIACAVPGYEIVNSAKGLKFKNQYGSQVPQLSLILPKQGSQYYVFTTGMSDALYNQLQNTGLWEYAACDVLSYYVVDMALNNGLGQIISYNNIIYEAGEPLSLDRMTAVRHANGRDWWLVKPHKTKQQMYTFLVTPAGVTLHDNTVQDTSKLTDHYIRGQATFSSDGTQFAMAHDQDSNQAVFLYSFDRCSGMFSNYRRIPVPVVRKDDGLHGVCFSPNGQLLYVASYYELNQIDLKDTSSQNIKLIDRDQPTRYFLMALANNGHIYVGGLHAVQPYLSYIHQPNKRDFACDFRNNGLECLETNLFSPPNVPNYRLGRLIGSPCDTVYEPPVPAIPVPEAWSIYPNPVDDELRIAVPDSTAQSINASMWNSTGQLIARQAVVVNAQHVASINVGYLATGVYVLKVSNGTSKFISKFVKE
jgi:Secretion system C-terminal sorting domain